MTNARRKVAPTSTDWSAEYPSLKVMVAIDAGMNDFLRCAVLMVGRHGANAEFRMAIWVGELINTGNLDGAPAMAPRSRHRGRMRRISLPPVRFELCPDHPRRFLPILQGRPHDPRQHRSHGQRSLRFRNGHERRRQPEPSPSAAIASGVCGLNPCGLICTHGLSVILKLFQSAFSIKHRL